MDGIMGSDEIESMLELLITVLFMIFCAFGIAYMVATMSRIATHTHRVDKLEVAADAQAEMDPFYYTGFQTYMFAYMMDPYSDQPLTWLGTTDIPSTAKTDGSDNYHVTICTLDNVGEVRPNFIPWRNQLITGGVAAGGTGRNVKDVIRSVYPTNVTALYRGTATRAVGGINRRIMFHLELTGDYTISDVPVYSHIGHTLVERRKVYQWVLVPNYH